MITKRSHGTLGARKGRLTLASFRDLGMANSQVSKLLSDYPEASVSRLYAIAKEAMRSRQVKASTADGQRTMGPVAAWIEPTAKETP